MKLITITDDKCFGDFFVILAEQHSDWRDAQVEQLSKLGRR
jgi:hypothetical protein